MNAKKILVVEDDKVTQKLISDALKSAGYQVFTAEDAVTAMGVVRREEPDLVTLDVNLAILSPGDTWDGFTLAHWLRRLNEGEEGKPKTLVVVLSGLGPEKILEKAAAVGAHTFLPKPFEKQKLLSIVAEALKS
jgi:CheY-like chemotaxis protein